MNPAPSLDACLLCEDDSDQDAYLFPLPMIDESNDSPEDLMALSRQVLFSVSTPRTRTLQKLVGQPAAPFLGKSEQARRTIVSKSSLHIRHARVVNIHSFHLPQQPACCRVERSKVTPKYETPQGPRHVFRLTHVSTERRGFSNRFSCWQSRRSLTTTSLLWSHRLLSGLSSLSSKSFRNQHFLRLSQTVFQRKSTVLPRVNSNKHRLRYHAG